MSMDTEDLWALSLKVRIDRTTTDFWSICVEYKDQQGVVDKLKNRIDAIIPSIGR